MTRKISITKREVFNAYRKVKQVRGGCGYDNQTIPDFEANLKDELYKIWNRLTSGSYMAQPVKLVEIPKVKGGVRTLGIPTVSDRIAQQVIKQKLEPILEQHFHNDSYGYRPNKSAEDALTIVRERCFKTSWVIDLDLKSYFDLIDHELLMEMVIKYTQNKEIHLYTKRFLKAKGIQEEETVTRNCGTPQGGVSAQRGA